MFCVEFDKSRIIGITDGRFDTSRIINITDGRNRLIYIYIQKIYNILLFLYIPTIKCLSIIVYLLLSLPTVYLFQLPSKGLLANIFFTLDTVSSENIFKLLTLPLDYNHLYINSHITHNGCSQTFNYVLKLKDTLSNLLDENICI